jgi:signal peptidase II
MGMEVVIVIIGLFIDRLTKIWAIKDLKKIDEIVVVKNIFSFQYLENPGAAWGILANKTLFLSILTFIVICFMVFFLIKQKVNSELLRVSFSLIIGGALGNLYDRMTYKYVIDFLMLHYKDIYYFPTFNIADMMVVFGSFLLAGCIIKDVK